MGEIRKSLLRMGTTTFVEYYQLFEKYKYSDNDEDIINALKKDKNNWGINSLKIKAATGRKIFENEQEVEALLYIINVVNLNKVSPSIIAKAENIYNSIIDKINKLEI